MPTLLAREWVSSVVGVSFAPGYPKNLYVLDTKVERADRRGAVVVARLVREPDNPYDPNAIAVHVPALRPRSLVGHIPAALAERLAPLLDAGEHWEAEVERVLVSEQAPERPGLEIRARKR